MIKFLFLSLILLSCCGCQAAFRDWQKQRLQSHLSRVENYHGTITESGILDSNEDLVSEVWYEKPGHYLISIQAPSSQAGTLMAFDGKTLRIFYPKSRFGIVFKNLKPLTEGNFKQLIDDQFQFNLAHFDYEIGASGKVAGLPVVGLTFRSKSPASFIQSGSSRVYDDFSFPMESEIRFKNQLSYSFEFKDIHFNEESLTKKFTIDFPADTVISEWDFNSKAITESEAKSLANFKFQLPASIPSELKLTKTIRQKGPVPALTAIYEGGPYFMDVMVFRNYGLQTAPSGRGVKISAGSNSGRLIPSLHVNTYSFISGETQYVFIGNIPVEEMISAAASVN